MLIRSILVYYIDLSRTELDVSVRRTDIKSKLTSISAMRDAEILQLFKPSYFLCYEHTRQGR